MARLEAKILGIAVMKSIGVRRISVQLLPCSVFVCLFVCVCVCVLCVCVCLRACVCVCVWCVCVCVCTCVCVFYLSIGDDRE